MDKLRFRFLKPFATHCFILLKPVFFRIKELNVRGIWFMFFKTIFLMVFENIDTIILVFS